jgi:serine/threonine-protein kinase
MSTAHSDVDGREERWGEALAACLEAVENSGETDRAALLAGHPEFADELAAFFARRDRVERLVAPLRTVVANDSTARSSTGTAFPPAAPEAPLPGAEARPFGDYELLEELGRGGMGVVYRARQKSLNRAVALKLLRGDSDSAEAQRFRNEAEMVAHLDHPHIVPVYEVGEHGGRPYFSMKLVEGGSLGRHLGRYRADGRAAAALLAPLARAVHYAHQRGVLHRDLKPSNVLVGEDGRGYVTDFGLAKRLPSPGGPPGEELTQSGALVGTPSYMAPEQTAGKRGVVTTATDVYGLGTVLYALLTGRPPFEGDSPLDTLAAINQHDPEPPRRRNPQVDRDLETICLKCLQKEPVKRYASAEALADDLERWLKGEPIQARPVGRTGRLWRWCRRNPLVAGMAAAVSLVLLAAAAVSSGQAIRARQSASDAREAQEVAEERFELAKDAVDRYLNEVTETPELKNPTFQALRKNLLETALPFYQRLAEQGQGRPGQEAARGAAYLRLGRLRPEIGELDAALADLEKARDIFARAANESPAVPAHRRNLAACWTSMAGILHRSGRPAEAEAAYRESLAIQHQLVDDFPATADYRRDLANTQSELATLLQFVSRPGEAEATAREALDLRVKLVEEFPEAPDDHNELAVALARLANHLRRRDPAKACELIEQARTHHEVALKTNPSLSLYRETYAENRVFLGLVLAYRGDLKAARSAFGTALETRQHLADDFPGNPRFRVALADGHYDLANVLITAGNLDEAEAHHQKGLAIFRELVEAYPAIPDYRQALAQRYNGLAILLTRLHRPTDAEKACLEAIATQQQLIQRFPKVPDYRGDLATSLNSLAGPRLDAGKPEEARKLLEEAGSHVEAALKANPGNPWYRMFHAGIVANLGSTSAASGDWGKAEAAVERLKAGISLPRHDLYFAACVFSNCVKFARKDTKLPEALRQVLASLYGAKAVDLLRRAAEAGARDPSRMKHEPDLGAIRDREDFQKLIAELESQRKPAAPPAGEPARGKLP